MALVSFLSGGYNLHRFSDAIGLVFNQVSVCKKINEFYLTVSLLCDVHSTSHYVILMCVLTCIVRHNVLLYFGILAQQNTSI